MASKDEKSLADLPAWRIVVLFVVFIFITLIWEKLTHYADHTLAKKRKKGLRHTVHKVQEEVQALGLISFLLILIEEYLVEVCVDADDDDSDKDYKLDKAYAPEADGYEEDHGTRGALRLLLAAASGDVCPKGKESLWTIRSLHETHLFIFLLAITHIVYAAISLSLCIWKLSRWKKWENQGHELKKLDFGAYVSNRSKIIHYGRAFFAQFSDSVDKSIYLGLRRLFIERMEVPESFDFHSFLVDTMEEEFSKVVKLEWMMWVIAILWIGVSNVIVNVMTGLAVLVVLIVGTKLESVALRLGYEAFLQYADKPPPGTILLKRPSMVKRSVKKLSGGVKALTCCGHNLGDSDKIDKLGGWADPEVSSRTNTHMLHDSDDFSFRHNAKKGLSGNVDMDVQGRRTSFDSEGGHSRVESRGHDSVMTIEIEHLKDTQESIGQRMSWGESNGHAEGKDFSSGTRTSNDAVVHFPSGNVHIQMQDQVRYVEEDSSSDSDDEYVSNNQNTHHQNGSELATDANLPSQMHNGGILSWLEGRKTRASNYVRTVWWNVSGKQHELRRTFSRRYKAPDAINFFWYRRPRLLLKAFQYTYFETSLLFAVLLFNWWKDLDFIVEHKTGGEWSFIASASAGLLIMFFSALFVLPVYALTSVVGSHCPETVLRKAKKKNLQPDMINALERMSMNPLKTAMQPGLKNQSNSLRRISVSVDDSSQASYGGMQGTGLESLSIHEDLAKMHEKEQTPLNTLIGAMMEKKMDQLKAQSSTEGQHSGLALDRLSLPTIATSGRQPSLARVSMPIMEFHESVPPKGAKPEPEAQPSPAQRPLAKKSTSMKPLSRQSLPPVLARASLPLMELHDIEEVASPKASSPKATLKPPSPDGHVSELRRLPSGPPALERSSSPGPVHVKPDLARSSMPLMQVAELKHEASYTLHDIHEEDHHGEETAEHEYGPVLKRLSS